MDSSDDFMWTDASSSTSEEEIAMAPDKVNGEMSDVDSEKAYKKKLHKKILQENLAAFEAKVKDELLNETVVKREVESEQDSKPSPDKVEFKKPKKKKLKKEKDRKSLDNSETEDKISVEEKDRDTDYSDTIEHKITIEEHDVELSLKQRKLSRKKKKKQNKKDITTGEEDTQINNNSSNVITEKQDSNVDNDDTGKYAESNPISNKYKRLSNCIQFEDEMSEESGDDNNKSMSNKLKENLKTNKKGNISYDKGNTQINNNPNNVITEKQDSGKYDETKVKNSAKKIYKRLSNCIQFEDENTEESDSNKSVSNNNQRNDITEKQDSEVDSDNTGNLDGSKVTNSASKEYNLISNCIQFEDDNTEELCDRNKSMSYKIKKYLEANTNLHPVSIESNFESLLEDDLWLLTCPHDVDIASFKETDLTLDTKCKVKIDSQTYVGDLNESSKIGIMVLEHKRPVIKNVLVKGTINLHKRIPKAHVVEDNTTASNETEYIPLPETKCRHPLFGSDYKKAIKLPKLVKKRLKESNLVEESETDGKKKKKKKKCEKNYDSELVELPESTEQRKEKKSRKRKKTAEADDDAEQTASSKRRRLKKEPDANTWDSAKAIEESLFNY